MYLSVCFKEDEEYIKWNYFSIYEPGKGLGNGNSDLYGDHGGWGFGDASLYTNSISGSGYGNVTTGSNTDWREVALNCI